MELTHILLALVVAFLGSKLFIRYRRRHKFIDAIDKLPGPPSWPVFGTLLYDLIVPRDSKNNLELSLGNCVSSDSILNIYLSRYLVHWNKELLLFTDRNSQ